MYRILFSLLFFISAALSAQTLTQSGYVRTAGRPGNLKGTRLAGAVIAVEGKNAVQSQKDGAFSLAFTNAKAGSTSFRIKSVKLGGYSALDPASLSAPHPISPFIPFEIVLVSEKEKAAIRENVERTVKARYDAELARVKREKDQLGLRYQAELDRVNEKYKNCDVYVANAVERYANLDYATLSFAEATYYSAMERGDEATAEQVLSQYNVHKLQADRNAIVGHIAKEQQALENIDAQLRFGYEGRYELFASRFEGDSALHYLDLLVALDTTNVESLKKAGDYATYSLSDFSRAYSYYVRAARQAQKQYGMNDGRTAESLKDLAFLLNNMRRTEEARATMLKSNEIVRRCYGDASLKTAQSYGAVASCYDNIKDSTEVLKWKGKALAIVKAHPAITDRDSLRIVAILYNNMGIYYYNHHDLTKADNYYQLAVQASIAAGEKPTFYDNLCALRTTQGKYDEALNYGNLALESIESDPLHSAAQKGWSYSLISETYNCMKDEANRMKYEDMARDVLVRQYGEMGAPMEHFYQLRASRLSDKGKYAEALPLYEKILEIEQRTYSNNADTLWLYQNIAVCNFQCHKYAEAIRWYKKALHASEHVNGVNHANSIGYILGIVDSYIKLGAYDEALDWDKEAEKRTEATNGGFDYFHRYVIMSKTTPKDHWEKTNKKFMADKSFYLFKVGYSPMVFLRYGVWDRKIYHKSLIDYIEDYAGKTVGSTLFIGKKYYNLKIYITPYDYSVTIDETNEKLSIVLFKVGKAAARAAKILTTLQRNL